MQRPQWLGNGGFDDGLVLGGLAGGLTGFGAGRKVLDQPGWAADSIEPKQTSLADRLLKRANFPMMPHPSGQLAMGNPYGWPQQSYNNMLGMTPYQRAPASAARTACS